ncbi:MAG: tetratricopeptide repeat protein [Cyanobacteria bacterium P01_C01_bin.118]
MNLHFLPWLLATTSFLPIISTPSWAQTEAPLLQREGTLESGDGQLRDGSFIDEYSFVGEAGQAVVITLESDAFDTYLLLWGSNEEILADNDDADGSTDSKIGIVLPETGTYLLGANAVTANRPGQGPYRLTVTATTPGDPVIRQTKANQLHAQGKSQFNQANYGDALELFQQALAIRQDIGDQDGIGESLNSIGGVYDNQGDYEQALDYYQQALSIHQAIDDTSGIGASLNNIGYIYSLLDDYEQALDYYQQALMILQSIGNRPGEAVMLNNIAFIYGRQGNYGQALNYYQQSLAILEETGNRQRMGTSLNNIGGIYSHLGDTDRALDYYQQALASHQETGDRHGEALLFNNIGGLYASQNSNQQAREHYLRSLTIYQIIGERNGLAQVLHNLGSFYADQGNPEQSLDYYLRSLTIRQDIGDLGGQAFTLNNIGNLYDNLGDDDRALNYYEQSLAIFQSTGEQAGASKVLANIGDWFEDQGETNQAIVFYKQAINIYETIRTNNQTLSQDLQQTYTDTVVDNYRTLATLLLDQGRIPEAQQVLDLLKLEELREFTNTRAVWTSNGIRLSEPEQTVADAHGSLIALGNKLVECERNNCTELDTLYEQQENLLAQYDAELERFVEAVRTNRRDDSIFQDPDSISGDAQALLEAYAADEQNTLLVYPFVLEDKLWLVWVTVGDVVGSIEVPVSQGELATTVQQFGTLLNSRSSDLNELQATSQKLHNWIIQPIAAELEQNNIDHLVFVNDRVTRYIPMGALYDGENYLLERYTVSTVLAPGATDMSDRLDSVTHSNVLGLGLTEAVENFNPLPAVRDELAGIIKGQDGDGIYPGQTFLNQDFTFDAFKNNVQGNRILHVATHAAFEPGRPEESFIVLGDGSRMKIPDIETMQRRLRNLHLVVLSACQTALGGTNQEDGTEITGLSSYFLEANRAETVVASLWSVNDQSTSVLMQRFYENLAAGEPKADALRNAQLSLLGSDQAGGGDERIIRQRQEAASGASSLAHPYFWAPFILIGNGL